jgi:hypothetical protein
VTIAAAGDYYPIDLATQVAAALDANGTLTGDYAFSFSATTGLFTLSVTGVVSTAITWTSTAARDALGYTGNLSGAASYAAPEQSPYIWLPNVGRGLTDSPEGTVGTIVSDGTVTLAPTGVSKELVYSQRRRNRLGFGLVHAQYVWAEYESTPNQSLETFWLTVLGEGLPFRYHPDASVSATYHTYRATTALMGFAPAPRVDGWVGASSLWDWQTEVIEFVS